GGSLLSAWQGARGRLIATVAVMAICCYPLACAPQARADDSDAVSKADLQKVLDDLELQKEKLADQEKALAEQQHIIANQQNQLNFLKGQVGLPSDAESVPVMYNLGNSVPSGTVSGVVPAQDQSKPVGEAPISSRPEIAII